MDKAVQEIEEKYNYVANKEYNVRTTSIGFATWSKVLGIESIANDNYYALR